MGAKAGVENNVLRSQIGPEQWSLDPHPVKSPSSLPLPWTKSMVLPAKLPLFGSILSTVGSVGFRTFLVLILRRLKSLRIDKLPLRVTVILSIVAQTKKEIWTGKCILLIK